MHPTSRRSFLKWSAAAPLGLASLPVQTGGLEDLLRSAIVVDAACPLVHPGRGAEAFGQYLDQMIAGGVSLALGTVASVESFEETLESLYGYYPLFERFRDRVLHAKNMEDVRRAKAEERVAVVFHFQGTGMLDYDLGRLALFKEVGVRVIQLAYNWKFLVGDGCTERTDCGLTDFGISAVKEMNRLGIVVDCSHTGYRTTMDAIELSQDPVVFTHSNAWALCPSKRNLKDDQIDAVARKGGVIGMNAFPAFLTRGGEASLSTLLDHVDYISRRVGVEHVGLGLDFTVSGDMESYRRYRYDTETYPPPPWSFPPDIENPSMIPAIARGLRSRGYDEEAILGVLGGNLVRVFERVWAN
jgi:membrane dipeptidase